MTAGGTAAVREATAADFHGMVVGEMAGVQGRPSKRFPTQGWGRKS